MTEELVRHVIERACERGIMIAVAESCTGGMVAAALTGVPGSSDMFDCGFVTYSNAAKTRLLGVDAGLIAAHGAVSVQTARAMAEGVLARSDAAIALSVTGIAGPAGGSPEKPVGLVCFGLARRNGTSRAVTRQYENRGRAFIRAAATGTALELILDMLKEP
jgi:nicotinamide-nucleotide amidase